MSDDANMGAASTVRALAGVEKASEHAMPLTTGMTEASRPQFEEAYLLWAGAYEVHKVMMDDAMAGKTVDVDLMHQLLAEIVGLYQSWMRKSAPFVNWK